MATAIRYNRETKQRILDAVREARSNGRDWNEAHMLAVNSGYHGNVRALKKLIRDYEYRSELKSVVKNIPEKSSADLQPIQSLIDQMVQLRVKNVLLRIRAALDEAERSC